MMPNKITDFPPISKESVYIDDCTPVVVQHGCDKVYYRLNADQVAKAIGYSKFDRFEKLTPQDRHNLCDIVWYLKGLQQADKCPFTDQINTLEEVVRLLGDKFNSKEFKAKFNG